MEKQSRRHSMRKKLAKRKFWAFDSEFLMSGRIKAPEDIHSVQFSDGTLENTVVLENAQDLKTWLLNHRRVKVMYGFVVLPDMGSVEEWLGNEKKHVKVYRRGVQERGWIKYGSTKIYVYDTRPLLQSFGVRKLENAGEIVGIPKLPKPEWLGLRRWQNDKELEEFMAYAKQDAIITSKICQWLYENFGADASVHVSAGTFARDIFKLPARLKRIKKTVRLCALEKSVKNICFAGRSEGFVVGYTPNVTYNDVKSLYPCSLVATRALEIVIVEECSPLDLFISDDLNNKNYGWVEGIFETRNDLWGLPLRGKNNFYATGGIQGFYHTFDLAAAKAEIIEVAHAYRPIFKQGSYAHEKCRDFLLKRLEGKVTEHENRYIKAVTNSLGGKLGQSHPISATSNFFAYSTMLAHSHLIMSKLFDVCDSPVLAMDTDSIFSQLDMSGKHFDLTDGEQTIPLIVDVKGKGDLAFFRSKKYILYDRNKPIDWLKNPVIGRHGWVYPKEDFVKLFDGVEELYSRMDIKRTLLTRQWEAQKLAKGRWFTKPVKLDLAKIKELVSADSKRHRPTYDSYQLVIEHRNVASKAWNYETMMRMKDENPLDYPRFYAEIEDEEIVWF